MKLLLQIGLGAALSSAGFAAESVEDVKAYLLKTVGKMKAASEDFAKTSGEYSALVGADPAAAYKADPKKVDALVLKMQEDYKAMDSYGYETIEGIVAGVPSLEKFDTYLDAGVPASGAGGADKVAPVTLDLGDGKKIDKEGCLFTYIIEPALWAGSEKWVIAVGDKKKLPRPEVMLAAGKDVDREIGELQQASKDWKVSVSDCFGAMVVMTPTLSDYFEDWKESRFADEKSGKFQAVSRISDMRGIMSSCAVMYKAVMPQVSAKDKALAKAVDVGFTGILTFIDHIDAREKKGGIKSAEVDELTAQAKEKTDKLVPQIEQSAAVAGVKIEK